jgi:hypothetical protein
MTRPRTLSTEAELAAVVVAWFEALGAEVYRGAKVGPVTTQHRYRHGGAAPSTTLTPPPSPRLSRPARARAGIVRGMSTISIELGWSVVIPFIVLAADGVTADPTYVVPPEDLTGVFLDSVRVSLVADLAGGPLRSFRADAIGGSGSAVHLVTRGGGVIHTTTQQFEVTAPIDRSGAVPWSASTWGS